MKTPKFLLILSIFLLSSCKIYKDAFVNNYDGAGYFNKLIDYNQGNTFYIDSLNIRQGFDAIVFMHLKIIYSYNENVKQDEFKGYPEIHFGLTNEFINSDAELKKEIHRRGILARWFKYNVHDDWKDYNIQKNEKLFNSYIIFEAKSKMNVVSIDNLYLRFWSDSWIKILLNQSFRIEPNKINYLGTLSINLNKTDKYSGKTVKQAYTAYSPGMKEGYLYDLDKKLEYNEKNLVMDLKFIEENFPNLYNNFKDKVVYFQFAQ